MDNSIQADFPIINSDQVKLGGLLKRLIWLLFFVYCFTEFYMFNYIATQVGFVMIILLSLVVCLFTNRKLLLDKLTSTVYLILIFWLIECGFSVLWAWDLSAVFETIAYIAHYLVIFIICTQVFHYQRYRKYQLILLQASVVLYLLTALWEISTGNHLPVSKFYGVKFPVPTGPFYGENVMAAFMIIFLPLLLIPAWFNKTTFRKILLFVLYLACFALVTMVGARIAMLAIMLFATYQWVFQTKYRMKLISIAMVLAILFTAAYFFPREWKFARKYAEGQITSIASESTAIYSSSIQIRESLLREGIDVLKESMFLGVGGGNFEAHLHAGRKQFAGGMTNPHNWWLEILVNHGLLVFILFVYIYMKWLSNLICLCHNFQGEKRQYYLYHVVSLLLFLPASLLPSSLRFNNLLWIYFAYIHSVSTDVYLLFPQFEKNKFLLSKNMESGSSMCLESV